MTTTPKESPLPFPVRALLGMLVVGAAMLGVTLGARFPDRSGADDRCRTVDAFGDSARGDRGSVHIARNGQRYLFSDTCELIAVVGIGDERAVEDQPVSTPITPPTTVSTPGSPPITERVVIPDPTVPATVPQPTAAPTTTVPPTTAAPDPPAPLEPDPPALQETGGVCVPIDGESTSVYGPGDLVNTANGFGFLVLDGCDLQLVMQPSPIT